MRTISATLQTAARSPAADPYLRVRAIKKIGNVGRLDWERLYTGAEAETSHGAAQPGDGSLIRVRVNGTDPQYNRVATPAAGSDWATWTSLTGALTIISIAASGATVRIAGANATGEIWVNQSTDNGATWAGWTNIAAAGAVPTVIAVAVKDADTALVVYDRGTSVYKIKRTAAGWGAEAAWSNSVASITGLAAKYSGDFNVIVTGTELTTTHPKVWSSLYGDGSSQSLDTWSALAELTAASSGSNVSFKRPSLALADVFRLFFTEKYTGTTAYTRAHFSHTVLTALFVDNLWREPVPFNLSPEEGLAVTYATGSYVYLSTTYGVWRAPTITGTGLDVTTDVLSARITANPFDGKAVITLRNDAATYASPGAGAIANLQRGSQLDIAPGYRTTAGSEVSSGPAFWIESLQHVATPGKSELVVTAVDAWGLLRAWTARRTHSWTAGSQTVYQLLGWILARAGLELAGIGGGASAAATTLQPAFTIHPGATGAEALLRLLAKVPDLLFFRAGKALIFEPLASQSSAYSYGPTQHQILQGEYSVSSYHANQAQVYGTAVFSQDFNWTELELSYARLRQVQDLGLTAAAEALTRAGSELRDQTISARHDAITTRPHPGQELGDVIDVTDSRANLSAAKRRVLALDLAYDTRKGAYSQTLTLGDP